jgi:hypothetical protein
MKNQTDNMESEATSGPFERNHAFWYSATPKLFEWLEWVAVLGTLKYLFDKTHSIILLALLVLGYASLLFYFNGFLEHHFRRLTFTQSTATRRFISGLASALLAALAFSLAQYATSVFSQVAS